MQSTGQTSTQELSLVPMQGSVMTYAMKGVPRAGSTGVGRGILPKGAPPWPRAAKLQLSPPLRAGTHALRTDRAKTCSRPVIMGRAEGDALRMATPPITENTLELEGRRRGRVSSRIPARVAWLVADLVAVAACALLAMRA